MQAGAAVPQRGRDRRAERARGDAREVEQSRRGGNPVRRQSRQRERDQRNEEHRHRRALDHRRHHQRVEVGVGVEVRAHEQHQREDGERRGGEDARIDLVDVRAHQRREQDREQSRPAPAPCRPWSRCSPCTAAATAAAAPGCRRTVRRRATSRRVLVQKLRRANSRRSTTGCSSVSSQTRKIASPTTATIASTTICPEWNQSRSLPLSSMICSAPTQITSSPRPTPSIGSLTVGVSRSR